jgi:hypothetical protein
VSSVLLQFFSQRAAMFPTFAHPWREVLRAAKTSAVRTFAQITISAYGASQNL